MGVAVRRWARMTVGEFLRWDSRDGVRYELVDGEPRAMAPAGTTHGLLQGEVGRLIGNHLRTHRPGCDVVVAPGVIPRLLSAHNVRIPDLAVSCGPDLAGKPVLADPVLIVEILSPSNQAETWSNVWAYTSIPTVREILVLHTMQVSAELLRRQAGGEWPEEPEALAFGEFALDSIGLALPLAALYARTGLLPP